MSQEFKQYLHLYNFITTIYKKITLIILNKALFFLILNYVWGTRDI